MTTLYYGPRDRLKWHEIGVYDARFLVCLCHNTGAMCKRKSIQKIFGEMEEDDCADCAGLCLHRNRKISILIDRDYVTHDVIAHEVLHATHRLLEYIGMELGDKTGEAYSCLAGHLTGLVYKDLKKWKIRIK